MKRCLVAFAIIACVCGSPSSSLAGEINGQVSQAVADTWPAKWCQAQPGMTKEQLVAVMGPTNWINPGSMMWAAYHYQFNAFFDADGTVRQLDINDYKLSPAEKASLKCDKIRTRASVARAAARASAGPAKVRPQGCGLVTEAEMSAILGTRMIGEPRAGATECNYRPASGAFPTVKLTVDWGDGKIAMASARFMGQREPGVANPYDGIGDEAVAAGPALLIRSGSDLVTIVLGGVTGAPAKAKRIFDTAKGKM